QQCSPYERETFREKPLLRPQPERAPRSRSQKARAVRARVRLRFPVDGTAMLIRRTIAVFAVLRADAVTILCDLAGDPVGARKRREHVAHQLRLSNATGVPANDNQAPAGRSIRVTCRQFFPQAL